MRQRFLPAGALALLVVVAVASMGVVYGLWSKTLTIDGTVHTGEVNAEWSIEEVDQSDSFDDLCPTGGYTIGQDCDGDQSLDDDMEAEGKDVAECVAVLVDDGNYPDLDNAGAQGMVVAVSNAYPSYNCFVRWDVHNSGTIPIKIHSAEYSADGVTWVPGALNTPELHVNSWPPDCYTDDTQLEPGESAYCNLHVHPNQDAEQNATYRFYVRVFAHQWNEEPGG